MFRLSRPRSGRSGDRFSFHFSNFQAVQVPKGWDKLSVSLVSVQTGKTIAKLGKATVHDESCRWTETLTESISVSQDETKKENEESLLKFVVAMGPTRSGILGEANIHLARYVSSKASVPLSLPLSKCDHGTILQLKIQCQTPRTKFREGQKTDSSSHREYHMDNDESIGSSSSSHMEHANENGEPLSWEPSFSRSGSQHSFDSFEGSSGKGSFSPQNESRRTSNSQIRRQDSSDSENSTPTHSLCSTGDGIRPPFPGAGSSEELTKVAQTMIEELQADCRMWERKTKKAMLDIETLKKELSASQIECNSFNEEISRLKFSLEETRVKEKESGDKKIHTKNADKTQKELQDEISLLKESNADLADQLQKTQDSNAELLSILQELEGIVETQKAGSNSEAQEKLESRIQVLEAQLEDKNREIQMARHLKDQALLDCESKSRSMLAEKEEEIIKLEEQICLSLDDQGGNEPDSYLPHEVKLLKTKLVEMERECSELVEENLQLLHKLKEARKNSSQQDDLDDLNRNPSYICEQVEENSTVDLKLRTELERQISSLQKEIKQLKESIEVTETERNAVSQHLDDKSNELMVLNSTMESQAAAYKILERKSSDLEKGKEDLELNLSKLEEENMQLSERVSNLEARQRSLTDEKEACRLKLQHSDQQVANLHGEITRLESEIETQKVDMKQKLEDMQKQWLEAQEECEYLKKANPKLEVTVSNLMDECNSLQKLNADLKMHNKELQERHSILEAQVNDSEKRFLKCSSKIEALEGEFSAMLEVMTLKEESLKSQLETLVHENNDLKEKVIAEERMLNQMYLEKTLEVENLQKELVHFVDQLSALYGEDAKFASEAIVELSSLRAEKAKLEISLEEFREKFTSSENKLNTLQSESEAKVMELRVELSSFRQKHEVLSADHKKILDKYKNVKSKEKKCRSVTRDLEKKLKASQYEKLQLEKEISALTVQQQKAAQLQDEIVTLKNSLDEAKFENGRLRSSFDSLSGDHQQLMSEKASLAQKISSTEKAVSELEEYRCSKAALEEKILRLEGDLNARDALSAQDAELKIELGRIKRANNEMQRKIQYLEEDREIYLKKVEASSGHSEGGMADYLSKIQSLENELAKALEANDMYQSQLTRFISGERSTSKLSTKRKGKKAKDNESLIWNLQSELKDLRERYFQMSLKYAEVEAQREELVMKLKSKNNKRGWFS